LCARLKTTVQASFTTNHFASNRNKSLLDKDNGNIESVVPGRNSPGCKTGKARLVGNSANGLEQRLEHAGKMEDPAEEVIDTRLSFCASSLFRISNLLEVSSDEAGKIGRAHKGNAIARSHNDAYHLESRRKSIAGRPQIVQVIPLQ
jgi:hypothetical protein